MQSLFFTYEKTQLWLWCQCQTNWTLYKLHSGLQRASLRSYVLLCHCRRISHQSEKMRKKTNTLVFTYLSRPLGGNVLQLSKSEPIHDKKEQPLPVGHRLLSLRGKPQTQRQTANTPFTSSTNTHKKEDATFAMNSLTSQKWSLHWFRHEVLNRGNKKLAALL